MTSLLTHTLSFTARSVHIPGLVVKAFASLGRLEPISLIGHTEGSNNNIHDSLTWRSAAVVYNMEGEI